MKRHLLCCVLFLSLAASSCLVQAQAHKPKKGQHIPHASQRELIAFVSAHTGHDEIFVIGTDGKGLKPITKGNEASHDPHWSPDRRYIAFTRGGGEGADAYVIHPDGTGLKRLTQSKFYTACEGWLPRGEPILIHRESCPSGYYTIDVDGTHLKRVSTEWASADWTPNGKHTVFAKPVTKEEDDPRSEVWLGDSKLKQARQITHFAASSSNPLWSPDGSRFVFVTEYGRRKGVYVYNRNTNKLKRVLDTDSLDCQGTPLWLPNGQQLAFMGSYKAFEGHKTDIGDSLILPNGQSLPAFYLVTKATRTAKNDNQIHVMNSDGTRLRCLTNYWGGVDSIMCTRDGRIIFESALASDVGGVMNNLWGLHIINTDGTGFRTLWTEPKRKAKP